MRQYKRALQKRLDLHSVTNHTIVGGNEEESDSSRQNKRRTLCECAKGDGGNGNDTGGSGEAYWRPTLQRKQDNAEGRPREPGISYEDSRELGSGTGTQGATQKIGEAA